MSYVNYEKNQKDNYALFTLNRPNRLNALGADLLEEDQYIDADDEFGIDANPRSNADMIFYLNIMILEIP